MRVNLESFVWESVVWPGLRLGDALTALTSRAGLAERTASVPNPKPRTLATLPAAAQWIERATRFLDCEAEPVAATFGELEQAFSAAQPGLVRMPDGTYLAILRGSRRSLHVLTPALSVKRIGTPGLCRVLRALAESGRRDEVEQVLSEAGVPAHRRERAASLILADQLSGTRFDQFWMLRVPAGARASRWLGQAHVLRNGLLLIAAHITQYLLWLAAWWTMGRSALDGRIESGQFWAWSLLLLTLIPFRLLTTWMQGVLGIGLGGLFKQRLFAGALRLGPEEVRHQGIGHFLSQVLESEAVETLTLNGGIAAVLSIVELSIAAVILGRSAILLAVWFVLTLAAAFRFLKRFEAWTAQRRLMTHDLVENMVGNRTRLVQQSPEEWHDDEDQALARYFAASKTLDRSGALLIAFIPRGWLLLGLAGLVPAFVAGSSSSNPELIPHMAVALGGILLAYTAFHRLTASLGDTAAAWAAWKQAAPLFHAAARPEASGELLSDFPSTTAPDRDVIQADRLTFRYREGGNPSIQGSSLAIATGDRILLEGPSGGGKTTLASLLSGMRHPESGTLLAGGLDMHTLGLDRWRKQVATAPQFHENHVFTETLCFNLLMGRCWPPSPDDVEQAESLCHRLGLGGLLEKMPAGMMQMVGESGWQLSHGEKSRLYIARALLQGARMVILDESFAALDPESLTVALGCAIQEANTLMVIAHP